KSFFENEYVVQLLKTINEQALLCNEILKKQAVKPSVKETSEPDGSLKFTHKEIKSMPTLRDCYIRYHLGVYEIRYRKNGIDKSFSHKTITGAKNKAREFLSNFSTETISVQGKSNSKNAAEFCEYWLKNIKARQMKEVSLQSFFNKYRKHMAPVLKNYTLKNLTAPVIQKIFDSVTPRVAEDVRTIFNGMFKYAIANGLLEHSPMDVIIIKKHERENGTRLTREQEYTLLNSIKGTEYETTVKLYLYTGARPTELKSIEFDWKDGTFTLQNAKLKSYQKDKIRTLPIFPTLYSMKAEIQNAKLVTEKKLTKFLWSNNTGIQIKSLRHTFTSKCKEQGVLPELVNYWTGHTIGSDTSAKIYTHFDMKFQKKEARKITF
ncbi:MAG: hypothetical protein IJU84_01230, partial [Clostridia bacterium]|nr:hypothetical protein [Clostridia bacterium]